MPLYGVRRGKPHPGARIDPAQGLSQGIRLVVPMNDGAGPPQFSGDSSGVCAWGGTSGAIPAWAPSIAGAAIRFVGSSSTYVQGPILASVGSYPWSAAWGMMSADPTQNAMIIRGGNTLDDFKDAIGFYGPGPGIYLYFDDGSFVTWAHAAATYHDYLVTYDGANAVLYVDGVSQGAQAAAAKTFVWNSQGVIVGSSKAGASATYPFTGTIAYAMAWSRVLTPSEASSLAGNPWQPFGVPSAYFLYKSAAGILVSPIGFEGGYSDRFDGGFVE